MANPYQEMLRMREEQRKALEAQSSSELMLSPTDPYSLQGATGITEESFTNQFADPYGASAYSTSIPMRNWMSTNSPDMYDNAEDHRQAMILSGFAKTMSEGNDPVSKMYQQEYGMGQPDQGDAVAMGMEKSREAMNADTQGAYQKTMSAFGSPENYQLVLDSLEPEDRPKSWQEGAELAGTVQTASAMQPQAPPMGGAVGMDPQQAQQSALQQALGRAREPAPEAGYDAFSGMSGPGGPSLGQMSMEPSDSGQGQVAGPQAMAPAEEPGLPFSFGEFEEPIERGLRGFAGRVGELMMPTSEYEQEFKQYAPYTAQAYGLGPDRPKIWEQPNMSMPPEEADPSLLSSSSMQDLYAPMSLAQEAAPPAAAPPRYPTPPQPPPMLPMSPEGLTGDSTGQENPALRQALDRMRQQTPPPEQNSMGEIGTSTGGGARVPFMGTSMPMSMFMGSTPGAGATETGSSDGLYPMQAGQAFPSDQPFGSDSDGVYPMPLERFVPEIGLAESAQLEADEGMFDFQSTAKYHKRVTGETYSAETLDDGTKIFWAYKDTKNYITIGAGFNLDQGGAAKILMNAGIPKDLEKLKSGEEYITEEESHRIFLSMLPDKVAVAKRWVGEDVWDKLTKDRQQVLLNMSFNMRLRDYGGRTKIPGGITSLPRLLRAAVENDDQSRYDAAADRMLQYDWADDVGVRAERLSDRMRGTSSTGRSRNVRGNYMTLAQGGDPSSMFGQEPLRLDTSLPNTYPPDDIFGTI